MAKPNPEEEFRALRKPLAPQVPRVEIDLETLVAAGIAAVVAKSPKQRRSPRSSQER
jgi:hypothetical protein